jgi:hypothetical protein
MQRMKEIMEKMNKINDGTRSLMESIAIPEVVSALKDWIKNNDNGVLIGGNAISYYGKPRATTDVDILFLHKDDIPATVIGFKRTRAGAFQHNSTHVEVEVVTPESINISQELANKVFETSISTDGAKVASPSGLVALKLQRLKNNDIGDIVQMIHTGNIDLSSFPLSDKNLQDFNEIKERFA